MVVMIAESKPEEKGTHGETSYELLGGMSRAPAAFPPCVAMTARLRRQLLLQGCTSWGFGCGSCEESRTWACSDFL